jgi:hypothetical protein
MMHRRMGRSQLTRARWGNEAARANARWAAMTPAQRELAIAKSLERDINGICDVCGNFWCEHVPYSRIRNHRPTLLCPPEAP